MVSTERCIYMRLRCVGGEGFVEENHELTPKISWK